MSELKLFMILLGCKPPGRHIEQHDIFFGIARKVKDLTHDINEFWPEAAGKIHIDAWREVTVVEGNRINVTHKTADIQRKPEKLFFINLGGYQKGSFEEQHYFLLTVSENKASATKQAKSTEFFKHNQFGCAVTHVDDLYGIDVDEIYEMIEILPSVQKDKFSISITPANGMAEDEVHLGYLKL